MCKVVKKQAKWIILAPWQIYVRKGPTKSADVVGNFASGIVVESEGYVDTRATDRNQWIQLEGTSPRLLCLKGRKLYTKGTTAAGLARLAGSALAERVQSSGKLGAKVVRGGQQGGVTPHLGLALVLLGVRLRCVVEPLDPLLITARKKFPARSRVEAALWCLLLPEGVR